MSENLSSQRQLRFGELIRSLISECLLVEDFYNFSFKTTSITISYVKMSKDLRMKLKRLKVASSAVLWLKIIPILKLAMLLRHMKKLKQKENSKIFKYL